MFALNRFEAAYVAGFVAGSAVRVAYAWPSRKRRREKRRAPLADRVLVGLAGAGLFLPPACLAVRWPAFADYSRPAWLGWFGVPVFAAAILLLQRAHAALGRQWSARMDVQPDQALVVRGPYRVVRHPMYAAHALWGVAQALLLANWVVGPALLFAFVPLYLYRVPREERMLLERFGDEYRRYMDATGRLLPRFRREGPAPTREKRP